LAWLLAIDSNFTATIAITPVSIFKIDVSAYVTCLKCSRTELAFHVFMQIRKGNSPSGTQIGIDGDVLNS
jgi:hypothetical protein